MEDRVVDGEDVNASSQTFESGPDRARVGQNNLFCDYVWNTCSSLCNMHLCS